MSIKEITCNLLKIVKTGKYCLYCNDDQEWIIVDHFVRNLSYYTLTVSELWNVSFPLVYISHFLWCTCFDCYQLEWDVRGYYSFSSHLNVYWLFYAFSWNSMILHFFKCSWDDHFRYLKCENYRESFWWGKNWKRAKLLKT